MMVRYAQIMLAGLPESAEYRAILARGYLLSGDDAAAIATWQAMLDTDSDDYTALINLGNYYVTTGDHTAAIPYLQRAMKVRPTPFVAATLEKITQKK